MAVQGDKENETQTKAPHAAPGVEQPAPQMRAPGFTSSGGNLLFDTMNILGAAQSLGGAIEEYLKAIKGFFGNDSTTTGTLKINVTRLSEPNGAHAFIAEKKAIILLFADQLPADTQNFTPASDYSLFAVKALKAQFGEDMKLVNVVVVTAADYGRAQQMAHYISISLMIATTTRLHDMNIQVLGDNQYSIDPDVVATRNFINNLNPSAVMPRVDIGFIIYAKPPRRGGAQFGLLEDLRPIAAVGGYTEILSTQDQTGVIRFAPLVHITAIASAIPLPGIVPLCLTVAADQFISSGRWMQQFTSFQKGKPSLGNLAPDPADPKKLWFPQNIMDLDKWRFQNVLPALLAIDVVEGQARIPALAAYGYSPNAQVVYDQILNFFGGRISVDRAQAPYEIRATSYLGTYGSTDAGGVQSDSRNLDYLNLVASGGVQDSATLDLLQYPLDPAQRARLIFDKTGGQFRTLYRASIAALNPNLLATLAMAVKDQLQIEAPQGQSRMSPNDWLIASGKLYQASNFGVSRADARVGYGISNLYNV